MTKQPSSYLSSKLEGRLKADESGNSIFALEPIKKGELIAVFGGVVRVIAVLVCDLMPGRARA